MTTLHDELEYWKQFENGSWTLVGFTGKYSATYRNVETGRSLQVTEDHVDIFVEWEEE